MTITATSSKTTALDRYEAVIGVEVHCQLRTASKMFCACSTAYDGARPNSHVCPVCLGLPGALPVINKRAVELGAKPFAGRTGPMELNIPAIEGIGGSALSNIALQSALNPLTYNLMPRKQRGGPRLFVLDNVDPHFVGDTLDEVRRYDPHLKHTIVNVISKSGETAEPAAQFISARDMLKKSLGDDYAQRIVAVTDPAKGTISHVSPLAKELFDTLNERNLPTVLIGEPLEAKGFAHLLKDLAGRARPDGWLDAARAIMTTDTYPKVATARARLGDAEVTINGIAKGAGMIAPDMATMLSFVATDAPIGEKALQAMLSKQVGPTFNAITVDGDTSTSDTLMVFATGAAAARAPDRRIHFACEQVAVVAPVVGARLVAIALALVSRDDLPVEDDARDPLHVRDDVHAKAVRRRDAGGGGHLRAESGGEGGEGERTIV